MKNNKSFKKIIAGMLAVSLSVTALALPTSATGWVVSQGQYYYQKADGSYAKGWVQVGNYRYYLNNKGQAVKGFQKINGKTYYFANNFALYHGAVQASDKVYCFGVDGSWYKTLTVSAFKTYMQRAPQGAKLFGYSEPVRFNNKGANLGYSDDMNWLGAIDANFYKVFGLGSTKASTLANMPEEYKYQMYCASNAMNLVIVPNKTYQAYKQQVKDYAKTLKKTDTYRYVPTGAYSGIKLRDLSLCRPFKYLKLGWGLLSKSEGDIEFYPSISMSMINYVSEGSDNNYCIYNTEGIYCNQLIKSDGVMMTGFTGQAVNSNFAAISTHLTLNLDIPRKGSTYNSSVDDFYSTTISEALKKIQAGGVQAYTSYLTDIPDLITMNFFFSDYNSKARAWSTKYSCAYLNLYYLPTTGEHIIYAEKTKKTGGLPEKQMFKTLAEAEDFIFN